MHRDSARRAIAHAQHNQAQVFNKGRKPLSDLKEGDHMLVNPHTLEWLESKGEGAKLTTRWIGPFKIAQKINPDIYRLRMGDNYPGSPVINIQHLKKYNVDDTYHNRTTLPESFNRKTESQEDKVEKIVSHKRIGKKSTLWYLIRWAGYGPQFDTWATARDLKNSAKLLTEY